MFGKVMSTFSLPLVTVAAPIAIKYGQNIDNDIVVPCLINW